MQRRWIIPTVAGGLLARRTSAHVDTLASSRSAAALIAEERCGECKPSMRLRSDADTPNSFSNLSSSIEEITRTEGGASPFKKCATGAERMQRRLAYSSAVSVFVLVPLLFCTRRIAAAACTAYTRAVPNV